MATNLNYRLLENLDERTGYLEDEDDGQIKKINNEPSTSGKRQGRDYDWQLD